MKRAHFRFYAALNDFLPSTGRGPVQRGGPFTHVFQGRVSIKDMIESLGVPHTEVDLILVNGESVDFSYLAQDGDRVSVYPLFKSLDIALLTRVRPEPLDKARFVLDTHLGKLASYLRMLGIDTLYRNDYADEELARLSSDEGRILLTRDRGLLKRAVVRRGYCVRETLPRKRLLEVLRRFELFEAIAPFRRCIRCNGSLRPVSKQSIAHRLPPKTRQYYDEFRVCGGCEQVYWKGSHYQRMQEFIQRVVERPGTKE